MLSNLNKDLRIPEFFYDALAYSTPSAMFLVILSIINDLDYNRFLSHFGNINSFVYEILISFLIFGVLYYLGQLCTTISYYLIANPYIKCSKEIKKLKTANDIFITNMFEIKLKAPASLINEIVKRYARMVLSRNVVVFSLILLVNALLQGKYVISIYIFVFFLLAIIDSLGRLRALARESKEAISLTEEIKSKLS